MSDAFYSFVRRVGSVPFFMSARTTIVHLRRVAAVRPPFILASNHISFFDAAVLVRHTPHRIDFLTLEAAFRKRFGRAFLLGMNAFPFDRSRPDTGALKTLHDRLAAGRNIGFFPEGRIRVDEESILTGGVFPSNVVRLAKSANVPIVPVAVRGTRAYHRWQAWTPPRKVDYGIAYGEVMTVGDEEAAHASLSQAFQNLYRELQAAGRG